jgi:hypothetical protein
MLTCLNIALLWRYVIAMCSAVRIYSDFFHVEIAVMSVMMFMPVPLCFFAFNFPKQSSEYSVNFPVREGTM